MTVYIILENGLEAMWRMRGEDAKPGVAETPWVPMGIELCVWLG